MPLPFVAQEPRAAPAGSLAFEAPEASWLTDDLVADGRDVGTAEIILDIGERRIARRPRLARSLFQATP